MAVYTVPPGLRHDRRQATKLLRRTREVRRGPLEPSALSAALANAGPSRGAGIIDTALYPSFGTFPSSFTFPG